MEDAVTEALEAKVDKLTEALVMVEAHLEDHEH